MGKIVRKSVGTTIEGQIATAVIVSTNFLTKIEPIINLDFFLNSYTRTITKWCLDYFKKYGKAPVLDIQKIYDIEKHSLDDAESELIGTLLKKLSDEYVEGDEINDAFIYDNAVKHFEERDLKIRIEKADKMMEIGKISEARELLENPSKVDRAAIEWINPFNRKEIEEAFEKDKDVVLTLPGALGELIGPLERGWLFAIMGGFKKGKTFYETECGMRGLLNRKKVAHFSFEMNKKATNLRFYRRVSGLGDEDVYLYPVFDCLRNQLGTCEKQERLGSGILKAKIDDFVPFQEGHVICSVCRGVNSDYEPDVWYESIISPIFSRREVIKKVEGFERMFGDNYRLRCYPRFSAGVDNMKRDLDFLARTEGFIPDIVIADYANIMKPSIKSDKRIDQVDDVWRNLAGFAEEWHVLCITGSQGTRGSLSKVSKDEEDTPEWIGVLGHLDVFVALNQTKIEKKKRMIRFNVLDHRHRAFNPLDEVIVLQHLDTGHTILGSEFSK